MIHKLQSSKGKSEQNFHQNLSSYYDEMDIRRQRANFQIEAAPFANKAEGLNKIISEVLPLVKILRTEPQVERLNIKYYDFVLYCD